MIVSLNTSVSRALALLALAPLARCAPVVRPPRVPIATRVPRVTRPPILDAPQRTVVAMPEPSTRDPVEVSFAHSLLTQVSRVAGELQTTITVQSQSAPAPSRFERDAYASAVRLRHEPSGIERTMTLIATRPAVLAFLWNLHDTSAVALRSTMSAMMLEHWLASQAELRLFATFRTSGAAHLRWRWNGVAALVCAHETPAHGAVREGCWTERAPLAPLAEDAMQYDYRRERLQIRYARQGGATVTVRIDESGVRGARAVEAPDWGPLAHVQVRVLSYAAPERVRVETDRESFECTREAQWRCDRPRATP